MKSKHSLIFHTLILCLVFEKFKRKYKIKIKNKIKR